MKTLTKLLAGFTALIMLLCACNGGGTTPSSSASESTAPSSAAENPSTSDAPETTADPVEIRFAWWGSEDRHNAFEAAIDLYTTANPHVTIKAEYGAWDGWAENILTQLSGQTEADVLQVNYNWVYSFGRGDNVFMDLNTLSDYINLGNWEAEYLSSMQVNGQQAAVPHGMNGRVMVYTSPLFENAGISFPGTYAEVEAAGQTIGGGNTPTGADNKYVIQLLDPATPDLFLAQMLYDMTGKPMIVDGKIPYTVDEVVAAFQQFEGYAQANAMETFQQKDAIDNESNPVWTSGRGGSIYEWCSSIDKYANAYKGGGAADELVVAPYIVPTEGFEPSIYVKPNLGYTVSKNSSNPEVAADFLNFFFTDEDCVKALGTSIGISSNTVTRQIQVNEGMLAGINKDGYDMLNSYNQVVMSPYFEDGNVRGARYTAVERFRSGDASAEVAAQEYIERQQAELDKLLG